MKNLLVLLLATALISGCNGKKAGVDENPGVNGPIQLHPENPHYFLYKGKTLAIVSSAEHYGAVLNLDFDYRKYLETLAQDGMNYTRMFTGTYFEVPGVSFGIQNNTLAPQPGRVITPWKTIKEPSGKVKYDLSKWNGAYFDRLKDFLQLAAEKDIIVEVTLFSSIYSDYMWNICPQNPANNMNIDNELSRRDAQTLNNGSLFDFQAEFVRKMVRELNGFDNIFFEIQNEPWGDRQVPVYNIVNKEDLIPDDWGLKADFGDEASLAWQDSIASIITTEEAKMPKKHLIAQNYTSYKVPVPAVGDHISIINFHYAWPEAVRWNYQYDKVIGFDESGFAGPGDKVYRRQAWKFMLSGGGLFNNLDYSFFVGHEDGLGKNKAPGGGSKTLRKQLKALSGFLHGFRLEKMHPDCEVVVKSPGLIPYVMSDGNTAFAVFLRGIGTTGTTLELHTGEGTYKVIPFNTITGTFAGPATVRAENGLLKIDIQIPDGELALKIIKE